MTKQEFLSELREGLSGLPREDIEERVNFYSEMIDDRIEEGLSETDAVLEIGTVESVVSHIIEDISLSKLVKEKIKPNRRLNAWEIVLLALGSPIWLSLGIAAIAVVISIYLSVWAVVISLWSVFASLVGSAIGCVFGGVLVMFGGAYLTGVALIGVGLFCAGLAVFAFFGCKAVTKGILKLTKKMIIGIKNYFVKKEDV
ncbi:MAG: DUF1700 domain-containing protein [Clostridia bacterium]|nr:DUF1700 domain-containing protein [Clostridia bacterium]